MANDSSPQLRAFTLHSQHPEFSWAFPGLSRFSMVNASVLHMWQRSVQHAARHIGCDNAAKAMSTKAAKDAKELEWVEISHLVEFGHDSGCWRRSEPQSESESESESEVW